jgi:hypothetical protein
VLLFLIIKLFFYQVFYDDLWFIFLELLFNFKAEFSFFIPLIFVDVTNQVFFLPLIYKMQIFILLGDHFCQLEYISF